MKRISGKKMFWMVLILSLLKLNQLLFTPWIGIGSWDLNRAVGWGWDVSNFMWYNYYYSFFDLAIVFLVGYGYTLYKDRNHDFKLSMIHLGLLVLAILLESIYFNFSLIWLILIKMALVMVFIINVINSKPKPD